MWSQSSSSQTTPPGSQGGDAFGLCEYRSTTRVEVLPLQRGASLWDNYRYTPWVAETCHSSSTLLNTARRSLNPSYFHTSGTGQTNANQLWKCMMLWRLRQCGLGAKAKSRFFPRKLSWCWMCRDLLKQRAMQLLHKPPLHRLPPFQHSEGLEAGFFQPHHSLLLCISASPASKKNGRTACFDKRGKKKGKKNLLAGTKEITKWDGEQSPLKVCLWYASLEVHLGQLRLKLVQSGT